MQWIRRIFFGLLFAIPLMLVTFALAEAQAAPQPTQSGLPNCKDCHQTFFEAWENGAHGHATKDPVFIEAWNEQGKPTECLECHVTGYDPNTGTWKEDGVTCQACHNPITVNHPIEPMATDRSGKTCGDCHLETYFEWQVSAHREKGVDCAGCHDPHKTSLVSDKPAELCASCHRARSSNFAHSQHSQNGLACSDCHLTHLQTDGQQGHARRDHSFFVSLSACNRCHVYQMHDPVAVHPEPAAPVQVDAGGAVEDSPVTDEPPSPSSPIAYTALSGLVGVALGIIVAPWFERLNRRKHEDDDMEG